VSTRALPHALASAAAAFTFAFAALPSAAGAALNPTFADATTVSTPGVTAARPVVASADGTVVVAWEQNDGTNNVLMVSTLPSPNAAWTSPTRLSDEGEGVADQQY